MYVYGKMYMFFLSYSIFQVHVLRVWDSSSQQYCNIQDQEALTLHINVPIPPVRNVPALTDVYHCLR